MDTIYTSITMFGLTAGAHNLSFTGKYRLIQTKIIVWYAVEQVLPISLI